MKMRIEVGWSYPSSPNAEKFGMGKTGAFTVSKVEFKRNGNPKPPVALNAFNTKEEANAFATLLQAAGFKESKS